MNLNKKLLSPPHKKKKKVLGRSVAKPLLCNYYVYECETYVLPWNHAQITFPHFKVTQSAELQEMLNSVNSSQQSDQGFRAEMALGYLFDFKMNDRRALRLL